MKSGNHDTDELTDEIIKSILDQRELGLVYEQLKSFHPQRLKDLKSDINSKIVNFVTKM